MIDLTQYLSSITLKTAEKRLFWAFLKPIWVLKGIKIIFFTIISLYNDFWGQTKPLTTPNRDRLDTPHIIPYVALTMGPEIISYHSLKICWPVSLLLASLSFKLHQYGGKSTKYLHLFLIKTFLY